MRFVTYIFSIITVIKAVRA